MRRRNSRIAVLLGLSLTLSLLASCAYDDNEGPPGEVPPQTTPPIDDEPFEGSDWTFDGDSAEAGPIASESDGGGDGLMPGDMDEGYGGMEPTSDGSTGRDSSGSDGLPGDECFVEPCDTNEIPAGQLTAGEWNDLDNWEFWRSLMDDVDDGEGSWSGMEEYWGYYTDGRITVLATAGDQPVVDATATLYGDGEDVLWTAQTDNLGRAELFAGLFGGAAGPFAIEVTSAGSTERFDDVALNETVEAAFSAPPAAKPALELAFVIDTTGSMGDEMEYIKSELLDVVGRVTETVGNDVYIRTSLTFYRDEGDQYEARSFPFTSDIALSVEALAAQVASGGGDFPEAVDRGLSIAIDQQLWNPNATARLLFLVLDAPPHHDQDVVERIHGLTERAAEAGIRIIPVSASGIDKETEFLLRFLAISTGGTYTFITDHSGIGGDHLDPNPTIGQFDVELLNDLIVRVVSERTAL